MTHVAMPMVSSLTLDPQKQTGNTLKAVARSTDQSYAFTDNVELRKLSAKKGGQKGQFIVAAELEGPKIKSARATSRASKPRPRAPGLRACL